MMIEKEQIKEMIDIMQPEPHRILKIVRQTQAESTFRVEYDGPTQHGQFFMLSIPLVGEAPISISGKGEGYVEFTIRRVGRFTEGIFSMLEGNMLFIRGPFGHPWPVEQFENKDLLVISGGTGLAPVKTLLTHFYNHPEVCKSVWLISGFKDLAGVLFNEEREMFAQKFNTIYTLDNSSAPGFETGMVTAHIPKVPISSFEDYNIAIVGPPPMMHFSALECMKNGAVPEKIWVSFERKMSCAVGKCGHCKINETYVCLEGPVFNYTKSRTLFD